ncbi:MAG: acyl-CoA carboxylase subunit epsilon [Marmoricola sp.]
MSEEPAAPVLTIVTPDATPEEVAAIVAVFASLGGEAPATPAPPKAWSSKARRMRPAHPHGPGGWRASRLPR